MLTCFGFEKIFSKKQAVVGVKQWIAWFPKRREAFSLRFQGDSRVAKGLGRIFLP